MQYTYNVVAAVELDELLIRVERARQSQAWRTRLLERSSAQLELSVLRVLRAVERGSTTGDAPSIGQVAQDLGVEHSTASRMVAAATRSSLLSKQISEEDQRRCELTLTPQGRDALVETATNRRRMLEEVVDAWSPDEFSLLVGLLRRLASDFDEAGYR